MSHQPLVSTAVLADALDRDDPAILDIRSSVDGGGRAAFEAGHVPGSVHTDYVTAGWRVVRGAATGLLPEPDALSRLIGSVGLKPGTLAVVVSAGTSSGDLSAAARVYWTLKAAGHDAVSLLDGGFAAWAAEGRPVETGPGRRPEPGRYPVAPAVPGRALLADVVSALGRGDATLVDSRGAKSFRGEEKSGQVARAGRLPGAVLAEGAQAWDAAIGRLRPLPDLRRLFAPVPDGPVIAYCNTGHQAATDWFVLSELMGRPDVALYDGSLSEWTADPARPVETGPLAGSEP